MPLAMVTFMAPALAFLGGPKFMSWYETEPEPGLQGRSIALPRGKGTGGCTNINGQIFMRGQREDFDGWRDRGNPGWGYDDLLPYFRKLERFELLADRDPEGMTLAGRPLAAQIDPAFHGDEGPLDIAPPRSLNPMTRPILRPRNWQATTSTLISTAADRTVSGSIVSRSERPTRHRRGRLSRPRARRPNLTVIPDTQVTKVLFEGATATGMAWKRGGEKGTFAREKHPRGRRLRLAPASDAVRYRQGARPRPARHRAGPRSGGCRREPPGSPRRHARISRQIRCALRDFLESASTQYPPRP